MRWILLKIKKMNRANIKYDISDIFRNNLKELTTLSKDKWKVINSIINCRTKALGGHINKCDTCNYEDQSYNSCRNRHCPKCGGLKKAKWLQRRLSELLPVEYFHVVFTIPSELNKITYYNKKIMYDLLFKCVKETLLESALNEKNLGAEIGFMSILHTWGQQLNFHPHLHCVVPGGGLKGNTWIKSKKGFFIHVKKLSRLFRGKYLWYLKKYYNKNELAFYKETKKLKDRKEFQKYIDNLYSKEWVVYAKKPFAGPSQVLRYLSNYTHKIAISNYRIKKVENGRVYFTWKDYRRKSKRKIMNLTTLEFMKRFLLHILPKRFMKIRMFGIYSNSRKKEKLSICKELLKKEFKIKDIENTNEYIMKIISDYTRVKTNKCPKCKTGILVTKIINSFYVGGG